MVQDDPSVVERLSPGPVTASEQQSELPEQQQQQEQEQEQQQQLAEVPTATKIPTVTEIPTVTPTVGPTTPTIATVVMASKCQVRVILDYQ
ncbi:hypothetical protein AND_007348 [Anopheles darlingi]|uniref:Uncharacterized protein n=1 Tax=Anopheles darlingi TaxID=43151 RepID=W5JDP5_ANODA|nr:hypothetical protein AND_007348 [Anopheles darlingi]